MYTITRIMNPDLAVRQALRAFGLRHDGEFVRRDDAVNQPVYPDGDSRVVTAISPTGESSRFWIMERKNVDRFFPAVTDHYERVRFAVSTLHRRPVLSSPFYRSSININMYCERGDSHAAHVDSNPIANLLCLAEGTPLQLFDPTLDDWIDVPLLPGQLITFCGRDIMHRVPPSDGRLRVMASMNLYFPDDCYRPAGLDEVAYGES